MSLQELDSESFPAVVEETRQSARPMTPLERFKDWPEKSPTIAKLRMPGKVTINLPVRTGKIRFKMGTTDGNLAALRRGDGTVCLTNVALDFSDVVSEEDLLDLVRNGQSVRVSLPSSGKTTPSRLALYRESLKAFLVDAGALEG